MIINKRKISNLVYEYIFIKGSDEKLKEVYELVFEELENEIGFKSFVFKKYEKQ